jgi:hypothetical protein
MLQKRQTVATLSGNLARKAEHRTSALKAAAKKAGISLSGWIGTVGQPRQLHDEEGDNLNRIAIFMRGKMAQEDILDEFGQKEIYADYVIGELHCEDLDDDSRDDIATSSRQSIKEDDPRYQAVRDLIFTELRYIASRWSDWRREDGAKQAANVPAVSIWLASLSNSNALQSRCLWIRLRSRFGNTGTARGESWKRVPLKTGLSK